MYNHLEILDNETRIHSENVYELVLGFSKKLNLQKKDKEILIQGALLHDIGKALINQEVLLSPNKLTKEDFEEIKKHTIKGFYYSKSFADPLISRIILEHHERIDGNGYPYNKKENDIHYFSKIVSICDSFQTMTSKRIYKEENTIDFAIKELIENSNKQFDIDLVNLFINHITI